MAALESKTNKSITANDMNNAVLAICLSQKCSKLCHCFKYIFKQAIAYLYLEDHLAKADDFTGSVRFQRFIHRHNNVGLL